MILADFSSLSRTISLSIVLR
jgi:hypothetical protein